MSNTFTKISGQDITLGIPIVKYDIERRMVFGFATLDNVDKHDDVITANASLEAFAESMKNVREMHAPIAVGKIIDFEERDFWDESTEKMYTGIYVSVYISKGAESTWQKVIDGTLKAFSIFGPAISKQREFIPELGKWVNFITKYRLDELSLVDNPANPLAAVFSIIKTADGTGLATTNIENVFWCANDKVALTSDEEIKKCHCGRSMENVGWIESMDINKDSIEKVLLEKNLISKEGGSSKMADENVEEVKEPQEVKAEETVKENDAADENVQEAVEPDFGAFAKTLDNISKALEAHSDGEAKRDEAIESIKKALGNVEESVKTQLSSLLEKHESLAAAFTGFKENLDLVEKKLDKVDGATALRKSVDVEDQKPLGQQKEDIWAGVFSN